MRPSPSEVIHLPRPPDDDPGFSTIRLGGVDIVTAQGSERRLDGSIGTQVLMFSINDALLDPVCDSTYTHDYDLMTATCSIRPTFPLIPTFVAHRPTFRHLPALSLRHLTARRALADARIVHPSRLKRRARASRMTRRSSPSCGMCVCAQAPARWEYSAKTAIRQEARVLPRGNRHTLHRWVFPTRTEDTHTPHIGGSIRARSSTTPQRALARSAARQGRCLFPVGWGATGPGSAGRVVLLDSCLGRPHTRVSDMTATTVRRRSVSVSRPHTKPPCYLPSRRRRPQPASPLSSCLRIMHRDGVCVNLPRFLQNFRARRRTSSTAHRLPTSSTRSPEAVRPSLQHPSLDLLPALEPCKVAEPLHGELAISSLNRQCWAVHSGRTFILGEDV